MRGIDPALVYTACEFIIAATILTAALLWSHHTEDKKRQRMRRLPWDKDAK